MTISIACTLKLCIEHKSTDLNCICKCEGLYTWRAKEK